MKTIVNIILLIVMLAFCTAQDKIKISKIDDHTFVWVKDTTVVIMKIVVTDKDTLVNYHYYGHIKTTTVHHFKLEKFIDSIK